MSEKMAEEGGASNAAGSSGIIKFKDNFVKITKDHKRTIFIVSKSLELLLIFVAAILEGYKSLFVRFSSSSELPEYKDLTHRDDTLFRIVCTTFDGFFIFNLILFVSYLMGEQLPKKLLCIFSFLAAIFCLTTGIILIEDNGDNNRISNQNGSTELIVSGAFSVFAALAFALECIITYIYSQ